MENKHPNYYDDSEEILLLDFGWEFFCIAQQMIYIVCLGFLISQHRLYFELILIILVALLFLQLVLVEMKQSTSWLFQSLVYKVHWIKIMNIICFTLYIILYAQFYVSFISTVWKFLSTNLPKLWIARQHQPNNCWLLSNLKSCFSIDPYYFYQLQWKTKFILTIVPYYYCLIEC